MKAYLKRLAFYVAYCVVLLLVAAFIMEIVWPGVTTFASTIEVTKVNPWLQITVIMLIICAVASIRES